MARSLLFGARQGVLILMAALAYFGVRGLTEGDPTSAHRNAGRLLELEQRLGLDFELPLQQLVSNSEALLTFANWIYIWGHWPVVIATLVWLAAHDRENYYILRNAMFISGAIGLVIFAAWAVAPPRLFGAEYVDTVTIRSVSYRLLQPPALINKYAAVPSLHFGWNLLVGVAWAKTATKPFMKTAAVVMPMAMGFAVVATANHWVADVIIGGAVAMAGLLLQPYVRRWLSVGTAMALVTTLVAPVTGGARSDRGNRDRSSTGYTTKAAVPSPHRVRSR